MTIPTALLEHTLPGRTRFRVPARRRDDGYFAELAAALAGLNGVDQVLTTPLSGSVLVYHRTPADSIVAFARERGLFDVGTAAPPGRPTPRPLALVLGERLDQTDLALRLMSRGESNLEEIALGGLLIGALYQFLNGRGLPAGVTLLRYANTLIDRPSRRE